MTNDEEYKRRVRKLAHELRTPLSVICMSLQVMPSVRDDKEQFDLLHQMMECAGKEMTALIDSMAAEFFPEEPNDTQ